MAMLGEAEEPLGVAAQDQRAGLIAQLLIDDLANPPLEAYRAEWRVAAIPDALRPQDVEGLVDLAIVCLSVDEMSARVSGGELDGGVV